MRIHQEYLIENRGVEIRRRKAVMRRKIAILIVAALFLLQVTNCQIKMNERGITTMKTVEELFEREMKSRKIPYHYDNNEDLYKIDYNGKLYKVSIDNVKKDYEQSQDPETVSYFVEQILKVFENQKKPLWGEIKQDIYPYVVVNDETYENFIFEYISQDLAKTHIIAGREGSIEWISRDMLKEWNISEDVLKDTAKTNMLKLLDSAKLEIIGKDKKKAGFVSLKKDFLNASTILSPSFRSLVENDLGWPVLAVIPCRDFIIVFNEKDEFTLNRFEQKVVTDYKNSPYPLTTEILKISDEGITVIGKYPVH